MIQGERSSEIHIDGLTVSVGSGRARKLLLDSATLRIAADSRAVLCGPNGQGKSTLLNIIYEELTPVEGLVTRYEVFPTFYNAAPLARSPIRCLSHKQKISNKFSTSEIPSSVWAASANTAQNSLI